MKTIMSLSRVTKSLLVIIFISLFFGFIQKQKKIEARATTENNRSVMLYTDGTWEYHEIQKKQSSPQKASPPNHKYE